MWLPSGSGKGALLNQKIAKIVYFGHFKISKVERQWGQMCTRRLILSEWLREFPWECLAVRRIFVGSL